MTGKLLKVDDVIIKKVCWINRNILFVVIINQTFASTEDIYSSVFDEVRLLFCGISKICLYFYIFLICTITVIWLVTH